MHGPFQAAAVGEWKAAGQVATLGVARAAMAAASQPIWAKIMDYMGRPFVVLGSCLFYCLGYVLLASSQNFGQLTGGLILYVFGFGGENSTFRTCLCGEQGAVLTLASHDVHSCCGYNVAPLASALLYDPVRCPVLLPTAFSPLTNSGHCTVSSTPGR
jgi:MFS family permease